MPGRKVRIPELSTVVPGGKPIWPVVAVPGGTVISPPGPTVAPAGSETIPLPPVLINSAEKFRN